MSASRWKVLEYSGGMATSSRTRVEDHLDRRRVELGLTWRDLYKRAEVSPETLRKIRLHGTQDVSPLKLGQVEDALGWGRGSIHTVETGGEPHLPARDGAVPAPAPHEEPQRAPRPSAERPSLYDLARDWDRIQGLTWIPHPDDPHLCYYVLRRMHRGRIWTHPQTVPATTPFEDVWRQLTAEQNEQLRRIDEALGESE